jgi:hypothetical protein
MPATNIETNHARPFARHGKRPSKKTGKTSQRKQVAKTSPSETPAPKEETTFEQLRCRGCGAEARPPATAASTTSRLTS